MTVTYEQLMSSSIGKKSMVFSIAEAAAYVEQHRRITMISSHKRNVMFFTNDHCFGYKHGTHYLGEDFVPSTFYLPSRVVPRPGLESGIVSTLADLMLVYVDKDERIIESIEELLIFINK